MAIPVQVHYSLTLVVACTNWQFMSLEEAQKQDEGMKTAFLSHSHKDRARAKGVEEWLKRTRLECIY